jgi:hypothetical protein
MTETTPTSAYLEAKTNLDNVMMLKKIDDTPENRVEECLNLLANSHQQYKELNKKYSDLYKYCNMLEMNVGAVIADFKGRWRGWVWKA